MSRKSKELLLAVAEQMRDSKIKRLAREFFSPRKDKPYQELQNEKSRAIFILYRCGYSCRKLGQIFNCDKDTILSIVSKVFDDLPALK